MELTTARALTDVIPDERIVVYVDSLKALRELNFDAHIVELQQVIYLGEATCDNSMLVERIESVITTAVTQALKECGVAVVEAELSDYQPLLLTLLHWENYIFPDVLLDLIEASSTPNEAYSVVTEELTLVDADTVLEIIDTVDPQVIERMTTLLNEARLTAEPDRDITADRKTRHRITQIAKGLNEARVPLVYQVARNGYQFGTSLNILYQTTLEELDKIPLERRAIELYLLYLYAQDPQPFQSVLEDYTDNIQERIALNAAVHNVIHY